MPRFLGRVLERRLTRAKAAELLGLGPRQTRRLAKEFEKHGHAALVSKRRGKRSNRKLPDEIRETAIELIRERDHDFGPTLALGKLSENHGIRVSVGTLRTWMIEAGIWRTRAKRAQRSFQPRRRRECLGELVQIDGCDHHWFEDRAPGRCTLLVFIDDATGRLMELHFAETESTFDYFTATRNYIERHGRPVAFYSDRASILPRLQKGPRCRRRSRDSVRPRAVRAQHRHDLHELEPGQRPRRARSSDESLDGTVEIRCEGRRLEYSVFDKNPHVIEQGGVVPNKRFIRSSNRPGRRRAGARGPSGHPTLGSGRSS